MITETKNPMKVRAGQIGALTRWGPPRVVRLDSLTRDQRVLVLALIDHVKSNEKTVAVIESATVQEVRRVSVERPS